MDIKAKVEEIIAKLKSDESLIPGFLSDPAGTVKKLFGVELDESQLKEIISKVSGKLNLDADGNGKIDILEKVEDKLNLGDGADGILGKIGGLLKK